jgi:hypothetical protein
MKGLVHLQQSLNIEIRQDLVVPFQVDHRMTDVTTTGPNLNITNLPIAITMNGLDNVLGGDVTAKVLDKQLGHGWWGGVGYVSGIGMGYWSVHPEKRPINFWRVFLATLQKLRSPSIFWRMGRNTLYTIDAI